MWKAVPAGIACDKKGGKGRGAALRRWLASLSVVFLWRERERERESSGSMDPSQAVYENNVFRFTIRQLLLLVFCGRERERERERAPGREPFASCV
jgi:hypothetical protein